MYSSTISFGNQYLFVQETPRFHCKTLAHRIATKERLGLSYLPKCRDPRCTHDCQSNWASKQGAVRARHLHDLPDDLSPIRGNLALSTGSTPEDHRQLRERFLQALRRWKRSKIRTLEIHAIIHADPDGAHYDFVGYHDGPGASACAAIRDLWTRSGGSRATAVALSGDEVEPVARYQTHPATTPRPMNVQGCAVKPVVNRDPVWLLRSRAEIGLNPAWQTSGFWRETTPDALWALLLSEWFPPQDDEVRLLSAKRRADAGRDPLPLAPVPVEPRPYVPGEDPVADAVRFAAKIPSAEGQGVEAATFAAQWGVSEWYLWWVLSMDTAPPLTVSYDTAHR